MPRNSLAEPGMQRLAERLAELVLYTGSVRAAHREIERVLREAGEQGTIYPNRLFTVLSADPTRGVNTSTRELLDRAIALVEIPPSGGERDRIRSEILSIVGAMGGNASTDFRQIADQSGFPIAVVQKVLGSVLEFAPNSKPSPREILRDNSLPDWSFQDVAVRSTLGALRKDVNRKVGLVVPTGGGKTRIAMRISLSCLRESQRTDGVVLWVSHRVRLKHQARRELQRLLSADSSEIGRDAITLFEKSIKIVMVSELEFALREYGSRTTLVVVDEAHHAAAPSYRPLFEYTPLRGLFLTATPNRVDELPIGVDEIAFSTTYRDLILCGAVVEPVFDSPLAIEGLDWTDGTGLDDLADYLLDKSEVELNKILVTVSRKAYAEQLYKIVREQLYMRQDHTLTEEDIGFVHAGATSTLAGQQEFLDEFVARPRGILIATGQLVGEGFDDPAIDGVVITYPSESIGHLMQVAGRALRANLGKRSAHIVQVHASQMSYHFEQRWLYQDISDRLRPQLIDRTYSSPRDLCSNIEGLLLKHNVSLPVTTRILEELRHAAAGGRYNLLLTGLPYYGSGSNFDCESSWGAILVSPENHGDFVRIFNTCSDRGVDANDPQGFLATQLESSSAAGSIWKSYMDMLIAMDYALTEIRSGKYEGWANRGYLPRKGTTWLKYVTFEYQPVLPEALTAFLRDSLNKDEIAASFMAEPSRWSLAVKIPLPLAGTISFLLDQTQSNWLENQRRDLLDQLRRAPAAASFVEIHSWRAGLKSLPVPLFLADHIEYLITEERFFTYSLSLTSEHLRSISSHEMSYSDQPS